MTPMTTIAIQRRDQRRAKRPPRRESMHFGDTVHPDDTSPDCQHRFRRRRSCKTRDRFAASQRPSHAVSRCPRGPRSAGRSRRRSQAPAPTPARPALRPGSRRRRSGLPTISRSRRKCTERRLREPPRMRPRRRPLNGHSTDRLALSVDRLRPLIRQRTDRRPDRRERDYIARRIGLDDTPDRRARFCPNREERCDRATSPIRHRSPRPAIPPR